MKIEDNYTKDEEDFDNEYYESFEWFWDKKKEEEE